MITIRGIKFEENLKNSMGLEFYDLSHPWGLGQPCWPYFEDVKIERLHSHGQVRRADAADHDGHALRHPHRCAGTRGARARRSWTRCRCRISSEPAWSSRFQRRSGA